MLKSKLPILNSDIRIMDIGYYGNSHEKIGIVLGIKKHDITVLNITDPQNRFQETIHRESFTAGNQNISDLVSHVKYETCREIKRASIGTNIEVRRGDQILNRDKKCNSKYIDLIRSNLYKCKHIYFKNDNVHNRNNNLDNLIKDIWETNNLDINEDFEKLFIEEVNFWNKIIKLYTKRILNNIKVWTLCVSYNDGIYTLHELGYQYVSANQTQA